MRGRQAGAPGRPHWRSSSRSSPGRHRRRWPPRRKSSSRSTGTERAYPLRGEPVEVTVRGDDGGPLAGVVVETLYRPNSQTHRSAWLAPTDAEGRTTWTPEDAGIVALIAHQGSEQGEVVASLDVTVRFGSFPLSGLVVMLVAGTLLFGGAGYGFVKLLGPEGGEPPTVEPPST